MTTTLDDGEIYLGLPELAEYIDVTYNSARTYHGRAEINRRRGSEKPGDLPPPDRRFGRSPVWRLTTIESWARTRPGRGTGGGAPERAIAS